ncbi:MAG TPA: ABC transporter substrate-binding protein [Burkholderiales bacterium]|nr:ABC transporter substrate-binding protein [Burkholderiales bacterium]
MALSLSWHARAQRAPRRMAWFGIGRPGARSPFLEATLAGMREQGWEVGRNLSLEIYETGGTEAEAGVLAAKMLASNPELVVVYGRDVLTVHRAKPSMPVVFAFSGDPADAGVVQSFARPGGNFTGLSFMSLELAGKRIEVLREIFPDMRRLGVLARPEHPGEHREREVSDAIAKKLDVAVSYVPIQSAADLDEAFRAISREKCDSLVTFPDGLMLNSSARIAKFALEARLVSISGWAGFADNGFLASYGPNLRDSYRKVGHYADRVLRGAKPSEIPVELPQTVEFVLNMRTAAALGLKIPPAVTVRADRIIE